jgi:hypothetical protein
MKIFLKISIAKIRIFMAGHKEEGRMPGKN